MRTIDEFATACRVHDRRNCRAVVGIIGWGVVGIVLLAVSFDPLESWLGNPTGPAVAIAITLLPMFLLAVWADWSDRSRGTTAGHCPGCRRLIARPAQRQRVVATRHCPQCQTRVLPDLEPAGKVPLRPLAEVQDIDRAGARRVERCFWGGFVASAVGMVAVAGLAVAVGADSRRGLFAGFVSEPTTAVVLDFATVLLLVFVPFTTCMTRFIVLLRRHDRHPTVRCPHCGGRLSVKLLHDTGNCGHCGRRAIALPVPPPVG